LKVSAGHEKSEEDLSLAVIDDVKQLSKIRDRAFINKMLLPLIENEVTIPVSFFETENATTATEGEDATSEGAWNPDFDALSCGTEVREKREVIDYSKNFLPSSILEPDQRQTLFKAYKEILGS